MSSSDLTITVSRRFQQSREAVFDGWLDPDKARRFMFTTTSAPLVRCDMDIRPGGKFVMTDGRPDGEVAHTGRYLEIERPARLVFSFGVPAISADEDRVVLTFESREAGCEVTLSSEMKPEWAEYLDGARQAWKAMLDGLAAQLG